MPGPRAERGLHVVATAGHVDHGKSSLIVRLTGIDPDRWQEEKRRGLTIDLGFAWCTLPSGQEIGFVDVPGHERFIRNMLAGVGPVKDVMFVVAADEGWKPQSEEHLSILDLLGARGVIALTKIDLVDAETLTMARDEIRERTDGTTMAAAPIIPVSVVSGNGLNELRAALDELADSPSPAERGRVRLYVDRVFSIRGAGTVVTGTLTGGSLGAGELVELLPGGATARIRGLQSHERLIERAEPVSRVAVNLAGIERDGVRRGAVLVAPDRWRTTSVIDVELAPIRGLGHAITARGAYKVYVGAAEIDARLRLLGGARLDPGDTMFARLSLAEPHPFDLFDVVILREAGRRETVAGGRVLDPAPTRASAHATIERLHRRGAATREEFPGLIADERGAVRSDEVRAVTGMQDLPGPWLVHGRVRKQVRADVLEHLTAFHDDHPLRAGDELQAVRAVAARASTHAGGPADPALAEALIEELVADGSIARTATAVSLASHTVALDETDERLSFLRDSVRRTPEQPPSIAELVSNGTPPELIDAAVENGHLVRVSNGFVFDPAFVEEATRVARRATEGITVSDFREQLHTSRKYAVPLLEHLDRTGVTRRDGDLRFPR